MPDTTILQFRKPGLQTLVQDLGRQGYEAYGVPVGGAMDKASAKIANWLVNNTLNNPVLEITLIGPVIGLSNGCQLAITGADLSPMLNGQPIPMYETIDATAGSVLSFGKIKNGCRAYLAVRGGWQIRKWLGSASAATHAGAQLTPDSIIDRGCRLTIENAAQISKRIYPADLRPAHPAKLRIGVLPGPEFEIFSPYAIGYFFSRGYRLTADSNRMGYRLDARLLDSPPGREVISSGIVPGTIQVTSAGQPIILMADAQTTGGYPRLVNVITADLDRLAQLKPGDEVWFSLVRPDEARVLLNKKGTSESLLS